jgi:hypothetical protein
VRRAHEADRAGHRQQKGRWLDVIFDDGAFLSDVAIAGAPIPTNPTLRAPIGLGHVICNAVVKDAASNHWRHCDSARSGMRR